MTTTTRLGSHPSFMVTRADAKVIAQIARRACGMFDRWESRIDCAMDITAAHANGCPLRLRALLEADDANFGHDVLGIARFLDRTTGQLAPTFCPRFAAPRR